MYKQKNFIADMHTNEPEAIPYYTNVTKKVKLVKLKWSCLRPAEMGSIDG